MTQMDPAHDPDRTSWQRFLSGRTGIQRFVLALGALATALLAVGGLIAGVAALVRDRGDPNVPPAVGVADSIENQSRQADEFVRFLLQAAGGAPLQLDHQVLAPKGDGHFRLEYNCAPAAGCNFVRLGTPRDIPAEISDGVWYQGCWSVTKDGAGYGADLLDIALEKQGDLCPTFPST